MYFGRWIVENYSRLLGWGVENFMSIKKAWVEFDDQNILNFKGYNDSGKSAMLTALRVLMTNSTPTKQASFIRDDESYFRIYAKFSDGVSILRDKYINGQSLYEMSVNNEVVFSTRVNKVLTKVDKVPQPIADYLGLITFNGVCLNARACFEKKIGVETTGSENYQMFSAVLRTEELASAGAMLNADRNKLSSDIALLESDLRVMRNMCDDKLSKSLVDELKILDTGIDGVSARKQTCEGIISIDKELSSIQIAPQLDMIDTRMAESLSGIQGIVSDLDMIDIPPQLDRLDGTRFNEVVGVHSLAEQFQAISIPPQLNIIDAERVGLLMSIQTMSDNIGVFDIPPELEDVSSSRLSSLMELQSLVKQCEECETVAANLEIELDSYKDELTALEDATKGQFVRCPNCGTMVGVGEVHEDT